MVGREAFKVKDCSDAFPKQTPEMRSSLVKEIRFRPRD